METHNLNLFIVDDNPLMSKGLRNYLEGKFGNALTISTFPSGKTALQRVNKSTNVVILDYFLEGENGNDVLKSIKKINPKTEVIMLSSNEDICIAIESLQKGASDYVVKNEKAWQKLTKLIYNIMLFPVHVLVREFGVTKFVAIFLLTFVTMGIVVSLTLYYFDWNILKQH